MAKEKVKRVEPASKDIKLDNTARLKAIFPQSVKDGEIDFDALKLALGGETDTNGLSYGLSWAGKADCFRHIQQTTTATLKPIRGESVDFDNTENIFIEGDNLEVLKVLQKNYYGKVKMIYIDPPYNTGNDSFIYPDRFKEEKADYEERAGIKDAEGLLTKDGFFRKNSKDTGHFHSNWLCMMYPRLFLAKNLLSEDGFIFVSIDDNEVHNLKMIMNEIFGDENFRSAIVIKRGAKSVQRQFETVDRLGSGYETVLMYSKTADFRFPRLEIDRSETKEGGWNNHWRGTNRPTMRYELFDIKPETGQWRWSKERSLKAKDNYAQMLKELNKKDDEISQDEIDDWYISKIEDLDVDIDLLRLSVNGKPEHYIPSSETYLGNDVWFDFSPNSTPILKAFFGQKIFDNPKPMNLIKRCCQICNKNAIILDFFAGSCTTAHAVMQLNAEDGGNRKYICVQLAEPCDEKSEAFKAGYKTIADIGKERIRRAAKKIKAENAGKLDFDGGKLDLGFKVFKLEESNFKQWRETIKTGEELKEQMKMFVDNKKKGSVPEDMLYEIILKNSRFDLNVKLEKKSFDGMEYYNLTDGEEIICLADKITKKLAEKILKEKPQKFTCLDTAFKNNDQLKTNTALQMEAEKIEFKVI